VNEVAARSTRRARIAGWLLLPVAVLAALGGWQGWRYWQSRQTQAAAQSSAAQRVDALEQRLEALRQNQRVQGQRLQDAIATNRILRDEVLGLGQRGALLEETVSRLADPNRHGAQALRLDEVELLLSMASQRLAVAGDLDGARRACALAAGVLEGVDDHRLLNLRQVLAQERAALDALGDGPRATLAAQLDRFGASLEALPRDPQDDAPAPRPTWQRLLSPLVDVQPTRPDSLLSPADREAAAAALQIDLALARASLERGDTAGFRASVTRVDAWLLRLWPDSPALRQGRTQLQQWRQATLDPESPLLGSTLQQLREFRRAGPPARLPLPTDVQVPTSLEP